MTPCGNISLAKNILCASIVFHTLYRVFVYQNYTRFLGKTSGKIIPFQGQSMLQSVPFFGTKIDWANVYCQDGNAHSDPPPGGPLQQVLLDAYKKLCPPYVGVWFTVDCSKSPWGLAACNWSCIWLVKWIIGWAVIWWPTDTDPWEQYIVNYDDKTMISNQCLLNESLC